VNNAVLQRGGAIEAVNQAARSLLGVARRDRRRNITELVRDPAVAALLRGGVEDGIVELPSPVHEARRLELRHMQVDEDRSIVLIRDVTMLDRLLTMRQDFIANVSHELRTPLTVVIGYLEALEDDDIDPQTMRRLLGRLRAPADRMKALVEDLLTLTRLESSPMPGDDDMEQVNAATMLESVVHEARQLATAEHGIVLEADPDIPARAVPAEIHSAFFNLVANAIRYSPDGGPVWVRWRSGQTGPRFEVEDRGLGIPPEHISRLTERFFRVDLAKSRVRGGTGLGLAIVKHILRRHRTTLGVSSTLGEGSLFWFELPSQPATRPAP
jgi:two-component system phosphate regulon sensor histidine kinase PhoR